MFCRFPQSLKNFQLIKMKYYEYYILITAEI